MAFLEVAGICKTFTRDDKTVVAIDNFNLSLSEGEFVSIVGPSSCGKSTFLHILGGFESRDAGEMRLKGRSVLGPGPDRGMLFQEFALFPWRSIIGNVGWALDVQGVPKETRNKIAEQNVQRALEFADVAYVVENGRVTLSGRGAEMLDDPHVHSAYPGI
jgi:NitT/TauT family transport system ATP-binding protein